MLFGIGTHKKKTDAKDNKKAITDEHMNTRTTKAIK